MASGTSSSSGEDEEVDYEGDKIAVISNRINYSCKTPSAYSQEIAAEIRFDCCW
jgi:hypothetical protein